MLIASLALPALTLMTVVAAPQNSAELFKLRSPASHQQGAFGQAVAVSGTMSIIGEPGGLGSPPGAAFLFGAQTGQLAHELLALDGGPGDTFGGAVGISGSVAIVGAALHDAAGINAGAAYLFDVASGAQTAKLVSSNPQQNAWFGHSVAISGTLAVVGAPFEEVGGFDYAGAVYLFDTVSGMQLARFTASDGEYGDYFGHSLAIDGNTLLVGAPRDDDNGFDAGSSYLFDLVSGMQTAKLLPGGVGPNDNFGLSVGLSGTRAIVGAYGDDDFGSESGAAYLFDTSSGLQTFKLHPTDPLSLKVFGVSVAISGDLVLVGAHGDSDLGYSAGAAYTFDGESGTQLDKILGSDGSEWAMFGGSVAVSGTSLVIGAEGASAHFQDAGAAYLFSTDLVATNYCAVNANSTGQAAVMSASGSPSLALNQFQLSAEPVPDSTYLFFYSTQRSQVPFGNGFLCAGGNIQRLGAPQMASGNRAMLDVDLASTSLSAVATSYFQCWFRDPAAGGSGFNLSDGLQVTFVP